MRIFISYSGDGAEAKEQIISYFRESGNEVSVDRLNEMDRADALFICISGKDNVNIKAELNMALERKLPVAYTITPNGYADQGLMFQLGLATEIKEGQAGEIGKWLEEVSQKAALERKTRIQKKGRKLLVTAVFIGIISVGVLFLLRNGLKGQDTAEGKTAVDADAGQNGTPEGESFAEDPDTEDPDTESSRKYLGADPGSVKVLDLSGLGLTDVSFLVDAVNLEELDLSNNQLTDINALVALKNLKKLDISGNPIGDDAILEYMKEVEITR